MAGKYQSYSEYKDSGIEWLGKIPKSWSISKHKYYANFSKGKNPSVLYDEFREGRIIYLSMDYLRGNTKPIYSEIEGNSYVSTNDQVLVIWDGSNAGEFVKGKFGIVSSTMAASELVLDFDEQYYWYVCVCLEPEMRRHATGMGIPHVNGEELKKSIIPIPERTEQYLIANFLYHETAKIDTLIEKQQQLIKLLKEKRQAVISHAVTKGLNPNAPMRDSGIEWLGVVPEHWEIMQIRRIVLLMEQGKSPECENRSADLEEWGVLKTSCVNNSIYNSEANKALPNNVTPFPQYEVKKGDVLMSRASGSINLIGSVAYVYESRPKILLSDKVFRMHLSLKIDGIFFTYLMASSYMRANIERAISGAESMANNITKTSVIGFKFSLPQVQEQKEIVKFIANKLNTLDLLIEKSESAILIIQERRTALISSAVTGKIDVRNWQVPNQSNTQEEAIL